MTSIANPIVRRHLEPDDASRIAEVHRNVYWPEFGFGDAFMLEVERDVAFAATRGWPEAGGVWMVESDGRARGSLALTFEGQAADGLYVGVVRWFALEMELRGTGLARMLFEELLETAEDQGVDRLELHTFSELAAAERLCRSYGFTLVSARERGGWRRDGSSVLYQHYVSLL